MQLQNEYYIRKLYPLQDKILRIVAGTKNNFYLTRGTALSRFYLNHRFSDDLDFFVNGESDFLLQVDEVINKIKAEDDISMKISKKADDFTSLFCEKDKIILKIDFVNDISYHSGELDSTNIFPRVDNWWNILSNKICALERREAKDVADIIFLCRKYPFQWHEVFDDAQKKTTYIDPLDVSIILEEFPKEFFSRIKWLDNNFSIDSAHADLKKISKDILQVERNSLCS
jgi:predicted nucleotidyltransferase component of viral defense system